MSSYNEVDGDLIALALDGKFDVIAHGCNCFCTQRSGLAPQMVKAFKTDTFPMEGNQFIGWINKLGTVDHQLIATGYGKAVTVVNAYTQYYNRKNMPETVIAPVDYEAITLTMRKMNMLFAGKHIGLPKIGAGLAGGDWERIKGIIQKELVDCKVTVVNYTL